jgi:ATP-dependent protease ClpP protease subunit
MLRDLAIADGLLERARMHAQEPPRFRFHGSRNPVNRTRTPILNQDPAAIVRDDGTAVMRIFEPIDSWGGPWGISAVEFVNALDQLPDDITGIELLINSPGGEVFEALAMLNSLRDHSAKVTAKVQGLAASAASFIASAADETIMGANAQAMIHDASGIVIGNARDMHSFGDVLDKISENIASIYASKSGKPVSGHRDAMHAETWYDAQEYVDAGLADSVAGDDQEAETPPEDAVNFDVKGSIGAKYANRAQAPTPGTVVDREPADDNVVDLELATANARARARQRQRATARV